MPKISKYKKALIETKKEYVYKLHKEGMTLREIEPIVDMSYEWIRLAIKEKEDLSTALSNNSLT